MWGVKKPIYYINRGGFPKIVRLIVHITMYIGRGTPNEICGGWGNYINLYIILVVV